MVQRRFVTVQSTAATSAPNAMRAIPTPTTTAAMVQSSGCADPGAASIRANPISSKGAPTPSGQATYGFVARGVPVVGGEVDSREVMRQYPANAMVRHH